ncbi:hypothetical protein ACFE04_020503 [Oxalis oulophora]
MPQCFHGEQSQIGPTLVVEEEEAATSPAKDVSDRGEDVIVDGCEPIADNDCQTPAMGETETPMDAPPELMLMMMMMAWSLFGFWFGVFWTLRWCSEGTTTRFTSGVKSSLSWIRHYRVITNCDSVTDFRRYNITIIVCKK